MYIACACSCLFIYRHVGIRRDGDEGCRLNFETRPVKRIYTAHTYESAIKKSGAFVLGAAECGARIPPPALSRWNLFSIKVAIAD